MIKTGCVYRSLDNINEYIFVESFQNAYFNLRIIYVDDFDYSEDIESMVYSELCEIIDPSSPLTPLFSKKFGLVGLWDGANRDSLVVLQNTKESIHYLLQKGFNINLNYSYVCRKNKH